MNALDKILAEVAQGEVNFPTHADVAFRVRLALDDPDIHLVRAAQIVQAEPLLAARVVAVANSIAFNPTNHAVADVRTAVTRLGIRFVRALATAVVMRQMAAGGRSAAHRALAERLWEHTAHVAALAHLLARQFLKGVSDVAMFAGIVHEVGGFYLISRTEGDPELLHNPALVTPEAEATIGRAVLAALAVPAEVVVAVESVWAKRAPALPPANLGDLLCLANGLTPILSPLQGPDSPSLMFEPGGSEIFAEILEQSGEEMGALTSALRY
jgi:HD-like signal output (HDOD) protein